MSSPGGRSVCKSWCASTVCRRLWYPRVNQRWTKVGQKVNLWCTRSRPIPAAGRTCGSSPNRDRSLTRQCHNRYRGLPVCSTDSHYASRARRGCRTSDASPRPQVRASGVLLRVSPAGAETGFPGTKLNRSRRRGRSRGARRRDLDHLPPARTLFYPFIHFHEMQNDYRVPISFNLCSPEVNINGRRQANYPTCTSTEHA